MKIIASISMSFLFFLQGIAANMEVCEQIKEISDFLAHYQEHKDFDGDSFLEFVYEDYFNDKGDLDGHHKNSDHEDAPVHTSHQCCQHFVFFAPFQFSLFNVVNADRLNQFNYYTSQLNSRYLESLFQPPRV